MLKERLKLSYLEIGIRARLVVPGIQIAQGHIGVSSDGDIDIWHEIYEK